VNYVEDDYSLVEAFLWLGIYLAINLQLSSLHLRPQWWGVGTTAASEFARPFYWTTWVLVWVLPPVVLARGIRQKDRFVIAVGAISFILPFVSNQPYLGSAPAAPRRRLAGKDNQWMNPSSAVLGLVTPQSITPSPQPTSADVRFGGGASGGGGAGGDF